MLLTKKFKSNILIKLYYLYKMYNSYYTYLNESMVIFLYHLLNAGDLLYTLSSCINMR